ncbi:hypothetical protein [Fibrella arboris]|uniref:hypothetical protein n=1 Tax=Fibrella arboris TaxID=3242486 RepID=UPI0035210CAA
MFLPTRTANSTAWASTRTTLSADLDYANVVSRVEERLRKKLGKSGSIQLTGSDFSTFAQAGRTQLVYTSESETATFTMDIGKADALNAQTWTLPADLTNQLDNVERRDFVSPGTIPASLRLPGVTHATRFRAANRLFTSYRQYAIKPAEIEFLGYSVDRKVGQDYETDSPTDASSFAVVPLGLGASFTTRVLIDDPDDETGTIQSDTLSVDGFGTLKTPNGTFQALRYTVRSTIRVYDMSGGGTPTEDDLLDEGSILRVGWVTKEGYWILADYTDYNATTGAATLSNLNYTAIVPTASLSPTFTGTNCGCGR